MTTRPAKALGAERGTAFRLNLVLTTRAAQDLLGIRSGGATAGRDASDGAQGGAVGGAENGGKDSDTRERGAQALAELLDPHQAYAVYLRNGGAGNESEQIIELRVASDVASAANAALMEQLGGKSLTLVGTEKEDRYSGDGQFLVIGARAIPDVWAQKDAWSRPALVSFGAGAGRDDSGFPARLLAAIAKMPEPRAQRESVQRRLSDWHRYLGVLERTAKARQFSVTFKAFRRGPVNSHLIFTLDPGREPIEWDKLRSAVDEPLEVRERRGLSRTAAGPERPGNGPARAGNGQAADDDADDWLLGYVVDCDPERNELRLALDEDVEKLLEHRSLTLPRSAALVYKASGDLAQVRRLKFGLEMLEQGYSENPRLSEFLFESARAGPLATDDKRVTLTQAELLQPRLNEGQRKAVEGALNAPDLFLIQGPPGTGKTTVIAEICYQNALRGQRTLIASQANLAVDHALSRLVHHPRIRALRRGRADRVEVEGAPFLEDQVVGTWLAKTAESCEQDLGARRDGIRRFEDFLKNRPRLDALAESLRRNRETRPQQEAGIAGLQAQIPPLKQTARALARRRDALSKLSQLQAGLATAATGGNGAAEPPLPAGAPSIDLALLDRLQLHDRPAMQQLRDNVDELNAALDMWESQPAAQTAPGSTAPTEAASGAANSLPPAEATTQPAAGEPPTISETIRQAAGARQRAKLSTARLAELRARLEALQKQGAQWLTGRDQATTLAQEHEQLAQLEAALNAQRAALESEREALQTKLTELTVFDAAQTPTRAALGHWIEALNRRGATGGLNAPPNQFASPLGREIWAAASETAQLHKLSALALETRTGQAEAGRLAELAARVSATANALLPELSNGGPPGNPSPLAGRRATHWRRSSLRGLVALDAHGELHPAFSAEAAWTHVEQELAQLLRRPGWWQVPTGAHKRRRQSLALWVERLKAAAEDFTMRRAALEALVAHRMAHLAERVAATTAVMEAAVVRASQAIGPRAEQRLADVNAGLAEAAQTQPAVTMRLADVENQLAVLAESHARRAAELDAGREALGDGRHMRPFQLLLRHVGPGSGPITPADWTAAWRSACRAFDKAVQGLGALAKAVDPIAALASLAADLEHDAARLDQSLEKARQAWRGAERDLQAARDQLRVLDEQQAQELAWWRAVYAALPDRLRAPVTGPTGMAPDSIEGIQAMSQAAASAAWEAELQKERNYLTRAEGLVTDWVRRLRAAARDPRDGADLKQIYIDNANVIGITCVQAGAYQFSRAYRNFDCVIVDEVSKATPPELLLPMLKGRRVVLVGDHKQLPPMIGPETLADLALEMAVPKSDLDHLERSLFKELFETAPPELRVMLTEQYRMHPQIMEAINQFYDGKLVSGIAEPDRTRAHGFQLPWLRPENHLLWINTPSEGPFVEQRVGTTFLNAGELDVIVRLVKALDAAWAPSVARGLPPKQVGVITFYGAQVRGLKAKLAERAGQSAFKNLRLRVGTVDRFQGMERQVIIASLVRNNAQGSVGFARKPERVNVAFSRAQELLLIVGSRDMFCERARDAGPGEGQVRAIYGRVAEVVARAGGQRRTTDVSDDFKR